MSMSDILLKRSGINVRCFVAIGLGLSVSGLAMSSVASAAGVSPDVYKDREIVDKEISQIVVIGEMNDQLDSGASKLLDFSELATQRHSDIHRVLRAVPGVTLQEEEGFGLRPNIGIRGTGNDRSGRITIMEDGILISPAPYTDGRTHTIPQVARMNAVEIVKGPATVRYGPHTAGGTINFYSTPVPEKGERATLSAFYGEDNSYRVHANAGMGGEHFGALIETYQEGTDGFQDIDRGGDTGFEVQDYLAKLRFSTGASAAVPQSLLLKAQYSDEDSTSSYLGLTDADFAVAPFRRYNGSQLDTMKAQHATLQATHTIEPSEKMTVTTTAYRTRFTRDWFKTERVNGVRSSSILEDPVTFADEFEILVGAPGFVSADDAITIRNNNRDYASWGIQSQLVSLFSLFGADHEAVVSVRYHEDEIDRFQNNEFYRIADTTLEQTTDTVAGSQSNRIERGHAVAVFAQDEVDLGRMNVLLGLRYENIDLARFNFGSSDSTRSGVNLRTTENNVDVFLPSLGVDYELTDALSVHAGVHRGFSPPSTGSADAEPETSITYEAGLRYSDGPVQLVATGFFNNFQNLTGVCTLSTGGGCVIGDQFDAGEVDVFGLEFEAGMDFSAGGISFPINLAYTYLNGEFQDNFESDYDPWGDVVAGDELPLLPNHSLFVSAGAHTSRLGADFTLSYVSETRAMAGQGAIPANQVIDSRVLVDGVAYFEVVPDQIILKTKVENAFNNDFIAARSPAGIRPGAARRFFVGVELFL